MPRKPKRARTLTVLSREGLVGPGTRIVVHNGHLDGAWPLALGETARFARFGDNLKARTNVVWELDDGAYSLTELRDKLIESGVPFTSGLVYEHWALDGSPDISLWDLAERIGR